MFRKNLLIFTALAFAGAAAIATAQDEVAFRGNGTTVWGKHARMTVVTESARSYRTTNVAPSGLVTIFNNIGGKYPQGVYWCCTGYESSVRLRVSNGWRLLSRPAPTTL